MKLYISGAITGNANYKQEFADARAKLESIGYEVCDPAAFGFPDDITWEAAMKYDIRKMLECDGVALLPSWRKSRGARVEARLAKDLGITARPLSAWLTNEKVPTK